MLLGITLLLVSGLATCCNGQGQAGPPQDDGTSTESPPIQGQAAFDADLAWACLEKQCAFGPRVPGAEAHVQCGDYLLGCLKDVCDRTIVQEFTHRSKRVFPGKSFAMRNLIGVIEPEGGAQADTRQVLLLAHWDSRPFADQEWDPAKRLKPVPGANDGASGVAAALEIARCLSLKRAPTTVIILLTDGEDFGLSGDPTLDEWFLGAKAFAKNPQGLDPRRGILLDMIGDKNVEIGRELQSTWADPSLVERIWTIAKRLGRDDVFVNTEYGVSDDHEPLIEAGLPVVDLIDWRPEVTDTYWHTLGDTPDKCSAEALGAVGEVVLTVLREGI
jgi:glutaminyl-peptide cyclotransferase